MFKGLAWMIEAGLHRKMTGLAAKGTAKAVGYGTILTGPVVGVGLPILCCAIPKVIKIITTPQKTNSNQLTLNLGVNDLTVSQLMKVAILGE